MLEILSTPIYLKDNNQKNKIYKVLW
jgi:hypothetical protein